jgi:hypothetical protein
VSVLHWWSALVAVAVGAVCLAAAVVAWARARPPAVLLDRLILLSLAGLVVTIVTGGAVALVSGPPRDSLHLVYGAAALLPLPVARYAARSGSARRRAAYLGLGALTTGGLLVRLFQTGG